MNCNDDKRLLAPFGRTLPTERELLAVNHGPNRQVGLNVFLQHILPQRSIVMYYKLLNAYLTSLRACMSKPAYHDDPPAVAIPWMLYCKPTSLAHSKTKNIAISF
uniref:Uncharacterized protein n=1 Tax=Glossina austeni TaxID=7395 RepID=A0A1A9VM78_GLOAU